MKLQTYPPGYDTGEEQVTPSDLQSHARTLLAVVEKVPHSRKCSIRAPHAATMDYKPTCNCPRGELIAGLKEMAK